MAAVARGVPLLRNPASRFAFVRQGDGVILFVDGVSHDLTGEAARFAEALCAAPRLTATQDAAPLIATLINAGAVQFDED
jgi:50S ribosomal protein L16 3-hydroxylase